MQSKGRKTKAAVGGNHFQRLVGIAKPTTPLDIKGTRHKDQLMKALNEVQARTAPRRQKRTERGRNNLHGRMKSLNPFGSYEGRQERRNHVWKHFASKTPKTHALMISSAVAGLHIR